MNSPLDPKISLLQRVKLQSEVLVPILKALPLELGEDRANAIVYRALRDWSRHLYQGMGAKKTGSGKQKWQATSKELDALIGEDVDLEYLRDDEPELGAILTCEVDDHVVAVGYPEVELSRPQTVMREADHCQFRYRFNKAKPE